MADTNPLQRLGERGQSVWLDFISRELVTTDQLQRMIDLDNVTGLTSNPTIFEKAIAEGSDYDEQLHQLLDRGVNDPDEQFLELAIADIRRAADTLRPVWERASGNDGFVSLEVPPDIADDTEATVQFAQRIWDSVERPNLMVKIPATSAGVPAIERSIAAGININVTLIFALASYERVIDAYLAGLEQRAERGNALDVHSVASFFVSRVDTKVDGMLEKLLERKPDSALAEELQGKAAIANAQLAYELFERHFREGKRFAELQRKGAHVQRPLWASTSAKNPRYRDVVYAEALIAPDTVDTMPPQTIEAFRDHGIVDGDTANADYASAHRVMEQLSQAGIDMDQVTRELLDEGVASFAKSYKQLIRRIAEKADSFTGGFSKRQQLDLGAATQSLRDAVNAPDAAALVRRIWARDPDVWKPGDAEHAKEIKQRLGWLDVVSTMREEGLPRLLALQTAVRDGDYRDAVVLGMGGSSLGPEVLRSSFGSGAGFPTLHVLDTTDPSSVQRLRSVIDPARTLFIVSSKSGGTTETLSHMAYFWEQTRAAGVAEPGRNFVCVTDPGTSLGEHARSHGFREVFDNPPDIGGRYSVMSYFGMVPAAVAGIDVERLLERAANMGGRCCTGVPGDLNPGLVLGTAMGLMHRAGRDKVTILAPPRIAAFSLWAEQLLAESTGKEGRAIIPIGDEPIGEPRVYGDDRLFVALDLGDDAAFGASVSALRSAGLPVVTLVLEDLYDLAAEFFRWEFATAVAGHHLQVDVFDQPNVQESKDNTKRILGLYEQTGAVADQSDPVASTETLAAYAEGVEGDSPIDVLRRFVNGAAAGDYVAIMAYVDTTAENEAALQTLRTVIRDNHRLATTLGFGPRFLHSTGQMHKGGPNTGVFVQITQDDPVDVPIPGQPFTFSILKQAQARGDLESLRAHGRRALRLHMRGDVAQTLSNITSGLVTAGAAH